MADDDLSSPDPTRYDAMTRAELIAATRVMHSSERVDRLADQMTDAEFRYLLISGDEALAERAAKERLLAAP